MTADSVDVYSSHAAFSILASALLPETSGDHFRDKKAPEQQTTWNLGVSINDFYYLSRYRDDRQKLLRCGTTIGISHLREREHANLQHIDVLGDVARRLLTSYLAGLSQSRQPEYQPNLDKEEEEDTSLDGTTRVFIIRPTQSSMFAPETLFKDLLEFPLFPSSLCHGMEMSESRALSLLDRVQLLPVHDFSSAAQAINQVSDALSHVREQYNRRRRRRQSPSIDNEVDGRDIKDDILQPSLSSSSSSSSHPPTALLMIEGLDTLAEDVIHSSNAMRGSAILTPILRTLNHLSRLHASFLSIVVINTTTLWGAGSVLSQQQTLPLTLPASQISSSTQTHNVHESRVPATTGGLHSAFAREYVHHRPQQVNLAGEQSLLNTLLSRTLDQGIDVHLLLQTVGEQTLVEVVKDRVGDGLGKWCVWS